jgi:ribosomal protein S18 acetylase RimI-like enzyme
MFVDLYVRASNAVAIKMYEQFGYVKYRQVLGYYSGEEDAYGACNTVAWCRGFPHLADRLQI